jgi:hypothetical protein
MLDHVIIGPAHLASLDGRVREVSPAYLLNQPEICMLDQPVHA